MRKNNVFLTGLAALALSMTFLGCQLDGTDTTDLLDASASRSAGVQVSVTNTAWFSQMTTGVARLDFTSASTAVGVFANTDHVFTYSLDDITGVGVLSEASTGYSWSFTVNAAGNYLTFTNGFAPYDANPAVNYRRIVIQASANLANPTGTMWLGRGPRGESYMYNVAYDPGSGKGTLIGEFGPDSPNEFAFTYTATATGGEGTMDGAGDFTCYNSSATMVFDDFWGHGVSVTFNLFTWAQ